MFDQENQQTKSPDYKQALPLIHASLSLFASAMERDRLLNCKVCLKAGYCGSELHHPAACRQGSSPRTATARAREQRRQAGQ